MAYITHSDSSPENNTSYINTGLVSLVPNNPYHPNATNINWPSNYDLFVNKTNDQQVSVSVSDETHAVAEITADSGLYLNHRPRRGTTIDYNSGAAGGAIDTGKTDYNHGMVYFSTLPTAEVTFTYLADPDKYYGEYLTQVQDVLHKLEIWAGAGNTLNEGVRSADILVKNRNIKIDSKLPNRIHVQGLTEDINFQSSGVLSNTITLGNSYDTVAVNAKNFNVFRGTFNDGSTGDPITSTITDHSGDTVYLNGMVSLSPTGITRAAGLTPADVTGLVFHPNTDPATGRFTGELDALRVYGNAIILGNLHTLGTHTVVNSTTTVDYSLFQEGIKINGNSHLGDATADNVYVSGPITVTGKITAKDNIEVTKSISLNNNNSNSISTVDGLDPSYIANRHTYMRPAGPDWCGDSINICSFGITAGTGNVTGGYEGATTHAAVSNSYLVDTGATGAYALTGIEYYTGRFSDGNWIADIRSGPDIGEKIPVVKWDPVITGWQLSRDLSAIQNSGVSYRVYNPHYNLPDFVSASAMTLTISASTTNSIVANVKGIVKVCNENKALALENETGRHYLFMSNENADLATLDSLESNPIWYTKMHGVPSDKSIIVGHVDATGLTPNINSDSLVIYQQSDKYDSTWLKVSDLAANNLPAHPEGLNTNHNVFYHNLGGEYRWHDVNFTILGATTAADGPNIDSGVRVFSPSDAHNQNFHIDAFNDRQFEMHVNNPGVDWIRVIAEIR